MAKPKLRKLATKAGPKKALRRLAPGNRTDTTRRKSHFGTTVSKSVVPEANSKTVSPLISADLAGSKNGVNAHPDMLKSQSGIDLTEKIKELVRLAQEQGYLTYTDINDALPDSVVTPEDLDEIYIK